MRRTNPPMRLKISSATLISGAPHSRCGKSSAPPPNHSRRPRCRSVCAPEVAEDFEHLSDLIIHSEPCVEPAYGHGRAWPPQLR